MNRASVTARIPIESAVAGTGQAAAILRARIPGSGNRKADDIAEEGRLGIKGRSLNDAVIMQRIARRIIGMANLTIQALVCMRPVPPARGRCLAQRRELVA